MKRSNVLIASLSAIAGGLAVAFAVTPSDPAATAKSDRLSGPETQTAFIPERFGVPSSRQY